jgi:hypothetical protein
LLQVAALGVVAFIGACSPAGTQEAEEEPREAHDLHLTITARWPKDPLNPPPPVEPCLRGVEVTVFSPSDAGAESFYANFHSDLPDSTGLGVVPSDLGVLETGCQPSFSMTFKEVPKSKLFEVRGVARVAGGEESFPIEGEVEQSFTLADLEASEWRIELKVPVAPSGPAGRPCVPGQELPPGFECLPA